MNLGKRYWAIPEGFLPDLGPHPEQHALRSHEAACVLNTGPDDAHLEITIYFSDQDPVGPYRATVPARRTLHLRFDDLRDPQPLPRNKDYASVIVADTPVVVQHTRLDARPGDRALVSTVAYGSD
jgi:hypothetical protein